MEKEQRRAENLTAFDRAVISELLEMHWSVIENKKSDAVTLKDKAKAWQQLAEQFNAASMSKRMPQQLKQVLLQYTHTPVDGTSMNEECTKPTLIVDYNKYMNGVYRCDKLLTYYALNRRSTKWWKKVFLDC